MNPRNTIRAALLAGLLLLSPDAQAETQKASVRIPRALQIAGTTLEQGTYAVSWETHSPEVTVTLLRGKAAVATAEGRIEVRQERYTRDTVVYANSGAGLPSLREIRFAGKKEVLVFD